MPGDSRLVSDIVESGEWRAEEEKLLCEARKSEHAERERERERVLQRGLVRGELIC